MDAASVEFCWALIPEESVATRNVPSIHLVNRLCDKFIRILRFILWISVFCGSELFERDIANGVVAPVLVVEVPPLEFKNAEAFGLHCPAEQIAVPALQRSAAGIVRE